MELAPNPSSAKFAAFFFKRYLDFELKFGDEARVSLVKQKADAYVQDYLEKVRGLDAVRPEEEAQEPDLEV